MQVPSLVPKEMPKVVSDENTTTLMCFTEVLQPSLPRFDVPYVCHIDFSPLHVDSFDFNLDCKPCVFLVDSCEFGLSVELDAIVYLCRV